MNIRGRESVVKQSNIYIALVNIKHAVIVLVLRHQIIYTLRSRLIKNKNKTINSSYFLYKIGRTSKSLGG